MYAMKFKFILTQDELKIAVIDYLVKTRSNQIAEKHIIMMISCDTDRPMDDQVMITVQVY